MALALVIVGLLLVVTGARDTYRNLGQYLVADFTGSQSFLYWLAAIAIIGAIGYYKAAETPARLFLALLVIVFILANGGVFQKFMQAIQQGPQEAQAANVPLPTSIPIGGGSGGTNPTAANTASTAISAVTALLPLMG